MMEHFESPRLEFRPFKLEDAKLIHLYLQEKEIVENTLTIPYPYVEGMAEEWINTHDAERKVGNYKFAIILKSENKLIGAIEIDVVREDQHGILGYWIAKPYWNQGYATEAIKRIIQLGFEDLALHRIVAQHFDFNGASGRAMEKNGMQLEGTLREHKIKNNKLLTLHLRAILKKEWLS